jgi:hypothetical protein
MDEKIKCYQGYKDGDGACCCNCDFQLTLTKHPWNKSKKFKGNIDEVTGLYVCVNGYVGFGDKTGPISDRVHGICELHTPRKNSGSKK